MEQRVVLLFGVLSMAFAFAFMFYVWGNEVRLWLRNKR